MKIILAGASDEQVDNLRKLFPAVDLAGLSPDGIDLDADALIAFTRADLDRLFVPHVLGRHNKLRWVHAPGAGIEAYLVPGLAEASFVFTNGKIIQGPEVADHAMALLLLLTRRLHYVLRGPDMGMPPTRPVELRGKRMTVIGAGGVGLAVAERAHGFGMSVDVVTEDAFPLVSFVDRRFLGDQLVDGLREADVVIMAAPVTPRSRHMIDAAAFAAMRPGTYFVNVSRGATVDTDALAKAVAAGRFAAVGLDVTDPEPLPTDHPLRNHPDVVVSPHLAGISDNLRARNFDLITTNIRRFVAGLPLVNVVDRVRGY